MKQFIYKWAIVRRYVKYITRGMYKVYNPQKDSGIYYGIYTYNLYSFINSNSTTPKRSEKG